MAFFTRVSKENFRKYYFVILLISCSFLASQKAFSQCDQGVESNPNFSAAALCNNGGFNLGSGASFDLPVATNTYYVFSWNDNGAPNINGFCATPNNGSGVAFTSNQTAWFSGSTNSLHVSSNRSSATWVATSGIMTYRHTTPNPATSVTSATPICLGSQISITGGGGGNGTLYFQGTTSGGTNTTNTINPQTFIPPAAGTFTYYWRSNNNGCWGNEAGATVVVAPTSVGGIPSVTATSACINTTVGVSLTGQTGSVLNWEMSFNGGAFTSIGGANQTSITSPTLSASGTYQFRALVQSSPCVSQYSNNSAIVTVVPATVAGTAAPALSPICNGGNTTITLSGQVGTVVSWERNLNGGAFSNIGLGGSTSIPTGALAAGTYQYRAIVQNAPCGTLTSVAATVVVSATTIPGNANASSILVCNGDNPLVFLTGNNGSVTFWERQVNGGGFNNIGNAGQLSFNTGALTPGVYDYRAVVTNGACPPSTSTSISITVSDFSVPGAAVPQVSALCQGSSTNITLSGQTGSILNWEQQINGGGWSSVGNAGLSVIGSGALNTPGTNEFRAVIQNGGCPAVQSAPASIAVSATSIGGTVSSSLASICEGANVTLTLSGETGTIVNWERQFNGGGWTNLGNPGVNPLTTAALSTAGTYEFRAFVQNGVCPGVYSTVVSVTVNPYDDATFSYSSSVFCQGLFTNPSPSIAQAGGTFTANPTGLGVDPATGIINLNASSPGTYSITHTTNGSCPSVETQSVTIIGSGNASFSYSSLNYCLNGSNAAPSITTPGGSFSSNPAGIIFANASTGEIDFANTVAGSYFVTYTLPGTCPTSQTQTVDLFAPGNSTFAYQTNTYCLGTGSNPSPSIAAFGGIFTSAPAGLSFTNNQTGTIDLATSASGTYTITYTSDGPCPTTTNQTVTLNATGNAQFNYSASSYCTNVTNPTPTITTAGGSFTATPAGITFVNASTGEINLAASQSGTYSLTYTLGGNCPSSSSQTITINAQGNSTFAYSNGNYCIGAGNNPSPIVSVFGGTFSASPAGLVFTNAQTGTIDLATSAAGTYTISYNSGGICPTTSTQSITLSTAGNAQFNYSASTYCKNAANPAPTITTPGGTFTASPGGLSFVSTSTGVINLTNSQPGTYTVTYSLSGACASLQTQTVTIIPAGNSAFAYSTNSYCLGTPNNPSPTIAQFGGTFSASPGGVVFSNNQTGTIDLMTSIPGVYTITYNSGGTCPSTSTQTIFLNAAGDPLFFYFASTFCQNATNPTPFVSQSGGGFTSSPAGLLFVSPATGEISLATSQPGGYVVTYNTGGLCPQTYSQNVLIIDNEDATFNYAQASYCQNGINPTPTVTQIGGTFTSTPGLVFENQFTGKIDLAASSAGTYTVTYTVPGACIGIYTQQVIITAGSVATLSYPASNFCSNGTDPLATISPAGGTFNSSPLGLSIGATGTIDLSASVPGAYTVSYTASGACGTTATANIIIVTSPQAFIQPINTLCTGSPATILTASPSGGTWSGGAYINASGLFDPAISGAGTFPVNYNVSGSGGCSASATYNVVVNASPSVNVTPAGPFCSNDSIQVLSATPLGGTWSGNPFVSINGLFFSAEAGAGVFPVMYTVNNGGCTGSAIISVQVLNSPNPSINPVAPLCASGSPIGLTSNISGGTWSGGPYVTASGTFNPSLASVGNNLVTYTVTNGPCTAQSSASIAVNGNPNVNIITPTPLCEADAPQFLIANLPGGIFTGGNYISGSGLFNPSLATVGANVVMYTVTSSNGCIGADTVNVTVNANPDATISYPGLVCENDAPFNLVAATPGGIFAGGPYVNSGVFDPAVAGPGSHEVTYNVTTNGCNADAAIFITVDPLPLAAFVYQPNGLFAYFTDFSLNATSWLWNFGDGSPEATVQDPTHEYPDNGIYQTRLIVTNSCGSDTLVLPVFVNKTVGVEENTTNTSLNIFPNPTDQFIQITASQLNDGKWTLNVLDVSGKAVMNETLYPTSGTLNKTLDVFSLKPGVYFINLHNGESTYTRKFVKM